jgi:hypothetical protein
VRLDLAAGLSHPSVGRGSNLRLYIVGTTPQGTEWVLRHASLLARDLSARLTLLVAQVVPFPLPLDCPPVPLDWVEQGWSQLAGRQAIDTQVRVCLCRDRNQTVRHELAAGSIVLIGLRDGWFSIAERILALRLRLDGHHVILLRRMKEPPQG